MRHYARGMDLVRHYRCELALRYRPVPYEAAVTDQEATVRWVLDIIGAPFDPKCLHFHQNQRYARTASDAHSHPLPFNRLRSAG